MPVGEKGTYDGDESSAPSAPIRAAGGLVWRRDTATGSDELLVCLVHRPRYGDWSLPKGKLNPGEHPLAAAVREIVEEAGVLAVPQLPLPPARYVVNGAEKVVDYWAMRESTPALPAAGPSAGAPGTPSGVDPEVDEEVDGVAWVPVAQATELATHPRDAALLRRWASLPPVTGVVLLVRHADAGERSAWSAADAARPLSEQGVAAAAALCRVLGLFSPHRLVSATPRRCLQTLEPLAAARDLPIEVDRAFDESAGDPETATAHLRRLADAGGTTVICSQGAVIPAVLARLTADGGPAGASDGAGRRTDWDTAKGDGWLLPFSGPRPLAAAPLRTAAD